MEAGHQHTDAPHGRWPTGPKIDGISVLKELKQDATLRHIPVILVTAKVDTRDIVSGLEAGGDDYITKPYEQTVVVARIRSLLRIKELHDAAQLQAVQLKEQTEQLSSWNRSLEERVAKQVAAIERIGRLRRFLPPQVAQVIASSDAPDSRLASHRREVTVLFCDLRGFTAFTEASEPEEVMAVLREYQESMGQLIFRYPSLQIAVVQTTGLASLFLRLASETAKLLPIIRSFGGHHEDARRSFNGLRSRSTHCPQVWGGHLSLRGRFPRPCLCGRARKQQ